jgi:hypothetical protein
MRKNWAVFAGCVVLLCTASSTATAQQSDSPTEDQCRADANAWQSEYLSSGYNAVALPILDQRAAEITNCGSEHGADANFDYSIVLAGIWDTEERRERAYITEHNLLNKFLAEDAVKAKAK